jgi:hypothetical protein
MIHNQEPTGVPEGDRECTTPAYPEKVGGLLFFSCALQAQTCSAHIGGHWCKLQSAVKF